MWFKEYKNYPIDSPQKKERLTPSKGIIGCEMHELNGWGEEYQQSFPKKKKRVIGSFIQALFSKFGFNERKEP